MNDGQWGIIVHGGAGEFAEARLDPYIDGCREAAFAGRDVLERGGAALDAAEAAVVVLEDNPIFNAGVGAPLNEEGDIELDASIMDGESLSAGAVAAVRGIKNPVTLARAILQDGRHILLAGEGAKRFAREANIAECAAEALITVRQRQRWQAKHGTVGSVARDRRGGLAAATSTGGLFNKLPGRVGDSALIGCGTYANEYGGVSCTGIGEAIIRVVLAKMACDYLAQGLAPDTVARQVIALLEQQTAGEAGIILIDRLGRIGYARNTRHMPVCLIDAGGTVTTEI